MFMTIGLVLFVFIVAFVLWYYSMVLMNALLNSEDTRQKRKEAIETLISVDNFLRKYNE